MSQNDDASFYREVDEDYRREQMLQFWKRYGTYIVIAIVAISVVVLGYTFNKQRQQAQAAKGGDALVNVLALQEENKADEAKKALADLAETGPAVYKIFARLQQASESVAKGQKDAAIENYRYVAEDNKAPSELKTFAKVQLAALSMETTSYEKLAADLSDLRSGTNPWRFSAKEILGLAAFKEGKKSEAERLFGELLSDGMTPLSMRQRAEIILALLLENPKPSNPNRAATGDIPNAAKTQ